MGLFDRLFGEALEPKNRKDLPWISLQHEMQLKTIKERSKTKPQIIFKHSTRCGISRMVLNQFEQFYNLSQDQADLYYLDLLSFRETSNAIAKDFKVYHQSPQLLVIKNGTIVNHASHSNINDIDLQDFV